MVLGSADDADDVVQSATERMWRSIGSVDPERGFRAWYLHGVANAARNHRRSRWRRRSAELRLASRAAEPSEDPERAAVLADERASIVRALNCIEPGARLVIALRHFEQLTEHEMAVVLECPAGTVKSRLSRAMAALRAQLDGSQP